MTDPNETAPSRWYVSAGADYIDLICPGCGKHLEMEQYTTYTLLGLMEQIEEHRLEKHREAT